MKGTDARSPFSEIKLQPLKAPEFSIQSIYPCHKHEKFKTSDVCSQVPPLKNLKKENLERLELLMQVQCLQG